MKTVDYLYHFTRGGIPTIVSILKNGFFPSYAVESLQKKKILLPMISFSNVLLRDVGEQEVLNYGSYAIGVTREWGIKNGLNPVIYTHEEGELKKAFDKYIENSALLSSLERYKDHYRKMSDIGLTFSKYMKVSNTSSLAIALIDSLTKPGSFNEDALIGVSRVSEENFRTSKRIVNLMKPYEVYDKVGKKFIAYNDREWRKTFEELSFIDSETEADQFNKMSGTPKPHISDVRYRTWLLLDDVRIIIVDKSSEVQSLKEAIYKIHDANKVDERLSNGSLVIDTLENLSKQNL
jgi:hypothetical protein